MATLQEMIPKVLEMWNEISPHMTKTSKRAMESRLRRAAEMLPGEMAEITTEQVRDRIRHMEMTGYSRKSILLDLNTLDDLFHVSDLDVNPALEVSNLYCKKKNLGRRKPRPGYARRSGYEVKGGIAGGRAANRVARANQPDQQTEVDGVFAALVCGHDRTRIKGESIGSVLLEAAVEMERMAKRGCRTFVLLFD